MMGLLDLCTTCGVGPHDSVKATIRMARVRSAALASPMSNPLLTKSTASAIPPNTVSRTGAPHKVMSANDACSFISF